MTSTQVYRSGVVLLNGLLMLFLVACAGGSMGTSQQEWGKLTEDDFLMNDVWNDGQAEIAFYRVRRSENQYGEKEAQEFLVGTYLVKHDFNPQRMAKATGGDEMRIPAFKYAQFYEFTSGSYEFKRSFVVNARRQDLRPFKHSFASFDWCSNAYREFAFHPDGPVRLLWRSDDYGNSRKSFELRSHSYPISLLPVLVRALDFRTTDQHTFWVVTREGDYVEVQAASEGTEQIAVPAGSYRAQRITLTYDDQITSTIGEDTAPSETYWRGTGDHRLLLKVEASSGRYGMELVEELRSPYWDENIWTRLERVSSRP